MGNALRMASIDSPMSGKPYLLTDPGALTPDYLRPLPVSWRSATHRPEPPSPVQHTLVDLEEPRSPRPTIGWPERTGLCGILHTNFVQLPFHALRGIRARRRRARCGAPAQSAGSRHFS